MIENLKQKLGPVLLALLIGVAMGYFATPTKVVTKTEIKEVEKKVDETQKDTKKNKVYLRTETILPDGTRKIETKIVDKDTIDVSTSSETDKSTDTTTEKTVERTHDGLIIYALGGAKLTDWTSGPEWGAGVQKRVLGPFWLGVYGTNKLAAGVTVGLSF